jgi:hypothetical protein
VSPEDSANGNGAAELPLLPPARRPDGCWSCLLLGIYFLFPKLVGLGDALSKLGDADAAWIAFAIGLQRPRVATYIALFKAVVGGRRAAPQLGGDLRDQHGGVAATLLFSAGGAGGIALTYWALRKAGMRAHDVGAADGRLPRPALRLLPVALIVCGVCCAPGSCRARTRSS